jgi:excisionase family DNA binding protein
LTTDQRLYTDMTTETVDNSPTIEQLLNADQVAERLGVKPRFVRRLVEERRIPFCKLGKFVRFRPTDIEAWLDTCTVGRINPSP